MIRHILIVLLLLSPCLAIETNATRSYVDEVARAEIENMKVWASQYTGNLESMDALMNDFGGVIRDTIITRALILIMIIFGASLNGLIIFYVVRQFYTRFDNKLSILEDKLSSTLTNESKKEDKKKSTEKQDTSSSNAKSGDSVTGESPVSKVDDPVKEQPPTLDDSPKEDVKVEKKDTKKSFR